MKPIGLLSQIAAIGLAVAIVIFFVQPTFADIGTLQDQTQEYAAERQRVNETNQKLAALVAEVESISVQNTTRLSTYLPALIDEVAVLRDLEIIAQNAGVEYLLIEYTGPVVDDSDEARLAGVTGEAQGHEFNVTVTGPYTQIKDFLSLLEQNNYPLHVYALDLMSVEGGFVSADARVVTYVRQSVTDSD